MQASASIAAALNPSAAPAGGQAVGAAQGLEGLLAGLFATGEEGTKDAAVTDPFAEALAAALGAPVQAQPIQATPVVAPQPSAEPAPAVAPATAQAFVLNPALLTQEAAPLAAPADDEVAAAQPAPQGADAPQADAATPDLTLALTAAMEKAAPPVAQSAAPPPNTQPVAAPPPIDTTAAPDAAVVMAATPPAETDAPVEVHAQAALQSLPAPRPAATEPNAKVVAKAKDASPKGETRGEPKAEAVPALAGNASEPVEPPLASPDEAKIDLAALPDAPSQETAPDTPAPQAVSHHEVRAAAAPGAEAPRATTQTVAHLAAQITSKLDGKSTRFDVQLDPHGLGKVDVRVEIAANGSVSAALTFENPQAAAELRGRQGELQAALEQAGFDLSKTSLSFNSGGQGQQGLFNQQQQQHAQTPVWRGRAFTDLSDTPETAPAPVRQRASTGVDVRI